MENKNGIQIIIDNSEIREQYLRVKRWHKIIKESYETEADCSDCGHGE